MYEGLKALYLFALWIDIGFSLRGEGINVKAKK